MKIKELGLEEDKQKAKEYTSSSSYNDENAWPRWRLVNELRGLDGMLEKFTKENEKLMNEKKSWDREIKELQDLLYKESKKVEDYKFKILKDTGNVMIVEEEFSIREANNLGVKNAMDMKQVEDMKD